MESIFDLVSRGLNDARRTASAPLAGADMGRYASMLATANAALQSAKRVPPDPPAISGQDIQKLTDSQGRLSVHSVPEMRALQRAAEKLAGLTLALGWRWAVTIEEASPAAPNAKAPSGDAFNLLARTVSFGSRTITGDPLSIGSGMVDRLQGAQGTQIRVTTLDTEDEAIRRWFEARSDLVARPDGTFGLPAEYALVVGIGQTDVGGEPLVNQWRRFLVRPATCEEEFSRDAMEMKLLTLVFDPMDSFLAA